MNPQPQLNLKKLILGSFLGFCRDGSQIFNALSGTIAVTNGSENVVGTGTSFTSALTTESKIQIAGNLCEITSITDDTHLTLSSNYQGVTAAALTAYGSLAAASGPDNQPSSTAAINFTPLGAIEDCNIKPKVDFADYVSPTQNGYVRSERLPKMRQLDLDVTVQDLSEQSYELVFLSPPIVSTSQTPYAFAPGQGVGYARGWLTLTKYAQGVQRVIAQIYANIEADAQNFKADAAKPKFNIAVLDNSLATGVLALNS